GPTLSTSYPADRAGVVVGTGIRPRTWSRARTPPLPPPPGPRPRRGPLPPGAGWPPRRLPVGSPPRRRASGPWPRTAPSRAGRPWSLAIGGPIFARLTGHVVGQVEDGQCRTASGEVTLGPGRK